MQGFATARAIAVTVDVVRAPTPTGPPIPAKEHIMSTTVLVIAMIVIAVFIVGFAVVARLFIGKQKGYDAEVAEAAEKIGYPKAAQRYWRCN